MSPALIVPVHIALLVVLEPELTIMLIVIAELGPHPEAELSLPVELLNMIGPESAVIPKSLL